MTVQGFIGVDPGASGGLACIADGIVEAVKMPDNEPDRLGWFRSRWSPMRAAIIEQVTGYVGDYGDQEEGNPGSGMFKFGMSYGGLRMALVAAGFVEGETFWAVGASGWQREIGIEPRGKGEEKTAFKNRLKAEAARLFPGVKVTLATCDALLIAEVCRRRHVAPEPVAVARPEAVRFGGV